jgi:aryl carrier-like protein
VVVGQSKALAVFICLSSSSGNQDDVKIREADADFTSLAHNIAGTLTSALASYMIPSLFFPVSRMPLTSSGKLDRRRLQVLVQSLSDVASYRLAATASNGRKPETRMEKTLQGLWAAVLNVPAESIGADDRFGTHGGDSVGAMRLVAAARKIGVMLTVANIFQMPKLSDMAAVAIEPGQSTAENNGTSSPVFEPVTPFSLLKDTANMSLPALKEHVASICRINPSAVEDIYPCTPLQSGLVAASQRQPGAYVAVNCYDLPAGTDVARFKQAWQDTADSEAILRTRILFVDGIGFLQVVVQGNITWATAPSVDKLPGTQRQLPSHDGGVLATYSIIGEKTSKPQFVWTAHHAIYDGFSLETLLSRVEQRYRKPDLKAVSTPHYSRFVEYLTNVDVSASDAFWTEKLAHSESAPQHFPQLPQPGYRVQATSHARRPISFTKPKTVDLTTSSYLRTAWALVLSTYSCSDDVVFGEVLNGRGVSVTGIEELVGPTLTTVPRRIRIDGSTAVQQVLADVQTQLNDVVPHQFAGLQRIKGLSPAAAAVCEFQNLLVVDTADEVEDGSLWSNMVSTTQGADFFSYPLNVTCAIRGSSSSRNGQVEIDLRATFDDKVVPEWQVTRMLAQFETILSQITAAGTQQQKLEDVDLLNADDKAVLRKWNSTPGPVVQRRVHDLISEKLSGNAEGTAVIGWDATLTNGQLDTLSTALARDIRAKLNDKGKSASRFVPFCFEKSTFAVVAMLAIMKAGAAFVPLDPAHPVARLSDIVRDCSADVIVCSPKHEDLCKHVADSTSRSDLSIIVVTSAMLGELSSRSDSSMQDPEGTFLCCPYCVSSLVACRIKVHG